MQISRHWRLNAQRYRLEGFALSNGQKSFQRRTIRTKEGLVIGVEKGIAPAEKVEETNDHTLQEGQAKAIIDALAGDQTEESDAA